MNPLEYLISLLAPHTCILCGNEPSVLCGTCVHQLNDPPHVPVPIDSSLASVWARTHYNQTAKEIISVLKFGRAKAAAYVVAASMAPLLPVLPSNTIICHVPTANRRIRARGYDQAALIARHLASLTPYKQDALLRKCTNTRQVGANRAERSAQMTHAFVVQKNPPKGTHVLLIDDVMTTGATLTAATELLRLVGVKSVSAAVFAYKP